MVASTSSHLSLLKSRRTIETRTSEKRETGCWDYRFVRDLEEDTAKQTTEGAEKKESRLSHCATFPVHRHRVKNEKRKATELED